MSVWNERNVEVEIDGVMYRGTYEVKDGLITVWYRTQKKSTQVGGSTPESLSRLLLREMVAEKK